MQQIIVPSRPNRQQSSINKTLLEQATNNLNIQKPLVVEWDDFDFIAGDYYPIHTEGKRLCDEDSSNYYHRILIADRLWPGEVSTTLWHELVHASQCERFPSFCSYYWAYEEEREASGYEKNIFEQEARYWSLVHPFHLASEHMPDSFPDIEPSPLAARIEEQWLTS